MEKTAHKSMKDLLRASRRDFMGQASCAGLGYLTFMNTFLNLKAMNSAAMANSAVADNFNDYKAIVCILLAGGNDSFNTLIPYDTTSHNQYVTSRSGLYTNATPGLAIPRNQLTNRVLNFSQSGKQWAVHPSMPRLHQLFNDQKAAFLANIGTLLHPNTTKAQYNNNANLPLGLFSHSDQIQQWQSGIPNERSAKGWAGKISDLIGSMNPNQNISMNISLSGSNVFQTGDTAVEYAIDPFRGAVGIEGYDPEAMYLNQVVRTQAIDSLLGVHYQDIFKRTFMDVVRSARDGFLEFDEALDQSISFHPDAFPSSYLGSALQMVARTISVRNILNFKRQVYFITVGGWDHHDEVINNQQAMLGMVDSALGRFQDAMGPNFTFQDSTGTNRNQTGVNVENSVLTMLITEFGRTLPSNGNGSDHGWGGNTFVLGGTNLINGRTIFGQYPALNTDNSNPLEVGLGRLIPTLSTDEYFAEIAKWFGVPSSDLTMLFPNLGQFYNPLSNNYPIGFIKS